METHGYAARPPVQFSFLDAPVEDAARRLLGCELVSTAGGESVRVRIVEVEAYDQEDPASHTFRGPNARNAAMFLAGGRLYVYRSHGIHFCCNVVTGRAGTGSGVLIRAAEPLDGTLTMAARRGRAGVDLTNGPGKLGQALAADLSLSGSSLADGPIRLVPRPAIADADVVAGVRVGISKAADLPRRFYIRGNPYVGRHHGAPGDAQADTTGARQGAEPRDRSIR